MKKIAIVIIAILIIGGAVAAFAVSRDSDKENKNDNHTNTSSQNESEEYKETENEGDETTETNKVEIENFSFKPATITVKKGTTVTWTNEDSVEHTVTPDTEGDFEGSDLLAKGETYSFTFDKVGTFSYHCKPHPQMQAKVIVTE
jgi:plastocyanin